MIMLSLRSDPPFINLCPPLTNNHETFRPIRNREDLHHRSGAADVVAGYSQQNPGVYP